jgi:glycerol-3-phosphate dehydrogenase subunit B
VTDVAFAEVPAAVDVLVVGGGVAGLLAALRARRDGCAVLVVARAGGGTPSWSGAVDVADDRVDVTPAPGGTGGRDALDRGGPLAAGVARMVERLPRHPYARAGAVDDVAADVDASLRFLQEATAELGWVRRPDGHNHVLATAAGTVKRAALVPASQHLDVAALPDDAIVGVVEWRDLAGFNAAPVAAMLQWVGGLSTRGLRTVPVPVPRVFAATSVFPTTTAFARHLDLADHRARAAAALRGVVTALPVRPTHLLTPPAWSRAPLDAAAVAALDEAVGVPTRELLGLPPSVPGGRLVASLRRACAAAGVVVVDGVVAGIDGGGHPAATSPRAGRRALATLHVAGAPRTVAAGAVVLAGGRFLGGGIVREHVAREPLFGLPVFVEGEELGDRFVGGLVADTVDGAHPLFRAGLLVDAALRPLGADRHPPFAHVFAAGAIVGGWDPARDGGAMGTSVWMGVRAGAAAAAEAR